MSCVSFKAVQQAMAGHLRDPEHVPAPQDIEDRRVQVYRDLIFNNIEGFVSGGFPVLRQIYSDENWLRLVRAFVIEHESHSPYFLHISQEFIQFLQHQYTLGPEDPSFLLELAHYEWAELALDVSDENEVSGDALLALDDSMLLKSSPKLSALAWPLSYQFPVHQLGPDFQPSEPPEQMTFLVVYRQQEEVKFMQTNAVTVRLLVLLTENPGESLEAVLMNLAAEMQHPQPEQIINFACALVKELAHKSILYID